MIQVREELRRQTESARPDLLRLSHRVHAAREIRFEERQSAEMVADQLAGGGFAVEKGICNLETAFVATAGSGSLTVGICAEYDALPGIGHACGHNIIASSAVGAGLALARVADDLDLTVRVLGTPAEESGGGKILMLERGAFDGVHAAMMVHPSPEERVYMDCLAVSHFRVAYTGKEAHASAYPERGVNAGDALTVAQVAIGLLRQHFNPNDQVHGIVTDGGLAPNIVPALCEGRFYARAVDLQSLDRLHARIDKCFQAGALATGCALVEEDESPPYSEFRPDVEIAEIYQRNAVAVGRRFEELPPRRGGSTDMANISLAMPTIHPMLAIESKGASNHQPEFTAACVTESADRAVVEGALAMALTVADLATTDQVRQRLLAGSTKYSQ
ncbi:MAG: M20 family metallopeptidase [Candidatus Dormibacteraeota bacterium]|uniref:Peptidase M20 domain-containing protein 2 n=1 Tax=Candidatus Dormiibacter inghamiae TaxID=3127013 RepID=A0A934KCV9_9BACT|nr:M20 family metallopeptidase [Candidatus Dormibacteraeota bacterium]MBJ7606448.1 M20 family metallopeptidase [Candidatus Dormibacteraeota bacterium]